MSKRDKAQAIIDESLPGFFNQVGQGLWRDGRILACALRACDVKANDVLAAIDGQAFMRLQHVSDMSVQEWFAHILRGQEMPSGGLVYAVCKHIELPPYELLKWCEKRAPLPDFIVEAQVLSAEDCIAQGKALDAKTLEFFDDVLEAAEGMLSQKSHRIGLVYAEAFAMVGMMSQEVWRQAKVLDDGYDGPVVERVLQLKDRISYAINHGDITQRLNAKYRVYKAVRKEHDVREKGLSVFAERLARSGGAQALLAYYKDIVGRLGAEDAQKAVIAMPETMLPMLGMGWRHSARVLLKSGKDIHGEEVLKQFCVNYTFYERAREQLEQAKVDYNDALDEKKNWQIWFKSQQTKDCIVIKAHRALIQESLGAYLRQSPAEPENLLNRGQGRGRGERLHL